MEEQLSEAQKEIKENIEKAKPKLTEEQQEKKKEISKDIDKLQEDIKNNTQETATIVNRNMPEGSEGGSHEPPEEPSKEEEVKEEKKPEDLVKKQAGTINIRYDGVEYMPMKVAALEVYNVHKKAKTQSLVAFTGILLTAATRGVPGKVGMYLTAGVAAILCMGITLYFVKDSNRMKQLEQSYNINPKSQKE